MHYNITNDDFSIVGDDETATVTSNVITETFTVIANESPAHNRVTLTTETGSIYATPLCIIIEDRRGNPTHIVYSSKVRGLNRSVFSVASGMVLFDIHNLYHPDAAMANILVTPSMTRYTSEKVAYVANECRFYTTTGTIITVAHDGERWISVSINQTRHDVTP